MIAGFVPPDSGRILLEDSILYDAQTGVFAPPQRRAAGYVPQRDSLFPHMTVRQNLAFAAARVPRVERHRRVAELLERFGLTLSGDARPCTLNPAQLRAAAVARALMASPKLLLLDDRGWDGPAIHTIREAASCPIVLVSSDLDLCCSVASMLVLLDAGRIVQRGIPSTIVNRPDSLGVRAPVRIPEPVQRHHWRARSRPQHQPRRNRELRAPGPIHPGHFRGDRITVAVHPADVRVHSGEVAPRPNFVAASLLSVSPRAHAVRLVFAGGLCADLSVAEFARQKDNKSWQLEFPPESLRVL